MNAVHHLSLRLVFSNPSARAINQQSVEALVESISALGLRTPLTVRPCIKVIDGKTTDAFEVVSGHHRLAAMQKLGCQEVPCFITSDDATACRMWEISENLHRAELPQLERDKLVAEWCGLVGKPIQPESVSGGRGNKGGEREAARQLGLSQPDVHRAVKVASLTPEAQEVAHKTGLADNRTALLEAATLPEAEQASYLERRAEKKPFPLAPEPVSDFEAREAWISQGIKWWNKGAQEWRDEFQRRAEM